MNNYPFSLDDFQIDFNKDLLGKGKFGYVYKAFCPKFHIYVALKMINKCESEEEKQKQKQLKQVTREYEIMKNINGPNLEKILGRFDGINPLENKQCYFFVLEFIEGENLDNLKTKYQRNNIFIDQNLIMKIFSGVETGLYDLHKNGIIHRDISPDNIMIDKNQQIKITDFGLSAYYIQFGGLPENLIYKNSIVGRNLFVGSEIIRRMKSNDNNILYGIKNDIFAFGITMYYLMTYGFPVCIKERIKNTKENKIINNISEQIYTKNFIKLIMSMLHDDQEKRPKCEDIYKELIKIKATNSAFNSVIICFASFIQFDKYLLQNDANLKKPEYEFNLKFIEALRGAKNFGNKKSDHINRFINCFFEKILFYDINEIISPINIIKSIFYYFLTNSPFVDDNRKGRDFSEKTKQFYYRNNILIDNKIREFELCYKNIFVSVFYFLVLRTFKCQKCNKEITQDLEIKHSIDLLTNKRDKKYTISELFKSYLDKKCSLNLGNNAGGYSLTCKNCGTMPKFLDEYREIIFEPEAFIFNLISDVKLEKYFDFNNKRYELCGIIFFNSNERAYESVVKYKEKLLYYSNNSEYPKEIVFENIEQINGIIAFYCLSNNEFSIFSKD